MLGDTTDVLDFEESLVRPGTAARYGLDLVPITREAYIDDLTRAAAIAESAEDNQAWGELAGELARYTGDCWEVGEWGAELDGLADQLRLLDKDEPHDQAEDRLWQKRDSDPDGAQSLERRFCDLAERLTAAEQEPSWLMDLHYANFRFW